MDEITRAEFRRQVLSMALDCVSRSSVTVDPADVIHMADAFAEFVLGESTYTCDDDLAFTDASVADVGAELDRQDAAAPRPTPAEIAACYGHVLDA